MTYQAWWINSGLADQAATEIVLFMAFCGALIAYLAWRDK
jgi:hypothetical protein